MRASKASVVIHKKDIDCHDLTSSSLAMTIGIWTTTIPRPLSEISQ
ncbi:hypothetical protein [Helicobacter sp. MIT 01-3238]|nr:hypothetical protein [Helicobacter sp. MIT 01-3238]